MIMFKSRASSIDHNGNNCNDGRNLLLVQYFIKLNNLPSSFLLVLQPELATQMRCVTVCLHMLVTFTACHNWKILQGKMGEHLPNFIMND